MKSFAYEGDKTRMISFPLGGIGAGSIGIDGQGRLIDWEIFNRPNKCSRNGFSFLLARAEKDGEVLDARVLNGPLNPHYMGDNGGTFTGFGFGVSRHTLGGVPHFEKCTFEGPFPIATLRFADGAFPGTVTMRAFNPLIPLNEDDSSLPAAFFDIEVVNPTAHTLTYSFLFSVNNPHKKGRAHRLAARGGARMVMLESGAYGPEDPQYGALCIATDAREGGAQSYWYRGRWFDNLSMFWRDAFTPGNIKDRQYPPSGETGEDVGTLEARVRCEPGATGRARFVLSWYYPNFTNYWNADKCDCEGGGCCEPPSNTWKNWYATAFKGADDVAHYALERFGALLEKTEEYVGALVDSTLPHEAVDAITANLSILKTPTAVRLTDGSFYGFEGLHCTAGCCEGTCTHVWNYAYALPYLFPRLERSIRETDYKYNLNPGGGMSFRMQLPLGRSPSAFRPCCDGQFGGVMKVYREWTLCGDTQWLRALWPGVKRSIEFAWSPDNPDLWDIDKRGVLTGRQHHTLDMELFGPNAWLTGMYLGALKAGARMAEALGDDAAAAEYASLFEKGKAYVDAELFNGEYYYHKVDLGDKAQLERYGGKNDSLFGDDAVAAYWNDEVEQLKYQIGEGCSVDQVLAQWHANLSGLGDIFDRRQTLTALRSIYKYNFIHGMGRLFNPCRLYCVEDESGEIICSYPEGRERPVISAPYAEETFHGMEYQSAAHMIHEGMVDEGMDIVAAVRARYDGERRNPWNEFECGSNYARSLASYALLPAFTGFTADMTRGRLTFDPKRFKPGVFKAPFSLEGAYGAVRVAQDAALALTVKDGALHLKELALPFAARVTGVALCGKAVPYTFISGVVAVDAHMRAGDVLEVRF